MKSLRALTLFLTLAILLSIVPAAFAQGPSGSWASGITCLNLGAAPATIVLDFYAENNAVSVLSYADPNPIPVGGTRNYYTPSTPPGLLAGFTGSAVVSSDQALACSVNTQTTGTGTTTAPYRIGTSTGVTSDAIAPTLYVPQVEKLLGTVASGQWSSYIAVQNTDSAAAAVTVSYKDRNGVAVTAATEHFTIPASSSKIFYQASNANLANGFLGSAIVSADNGTSKLASVVNLYNDGANYTRSQFLSYNAFTAGAPSYIVPRVVRNYYGYNGGITIQNVGGSATTVHMVFTFGTNTYTFDSGSIAAGASLALYMPNVVELAPVDSLNVANRAGSALVTAAAGGNVVVIVNEDNRGGAGVPVERLGQGASYNAVATTAATSKIVFAQIPRHAGSVFSGGFQIANTTANAGTCGITYSGQAAATESNVALPANGVIMRYAPNVANLPNGFNQAVTVQCTQNVVGIGNLAAEPGTGRVGDSFGESTGLNQ